MWNIVWFFNWPWKFTLEQRLLNFILYLEHDNVTMYDAFMWNCFKFLMCNDTIFISLCSNETIVNEIWWPTIEKKATLSIKIWDFLGCIKFIDRNLVKTRKSWNNMAQQTWFNEWKIIYSMNNMVIVNHQNLFIYIDNGYPRSYHDVIILWDFDIYINWCNHFAHANEFSEYLLGDPGYMGK